MYIIISKDNMEILETLEEKGYSDAAVKIVEEKEEGEIALEEASRIPAEVLLLDIDSGKDLARKVLRYRLKRPNTRIIVYAKDRKPGDSEVAAIVQTGVYDIAVDRSDLEKIIDSEPYGIDKAVKWIDPSFPLEENNKKKGKKIFIEKQVVKEVIVEKKVPLSSRPILIAVAGTAQGVGTTAIALTLARFLVERKYKTVYIELGEPSIEDIAGMELDKEPRKCINYLDVSKKGDYKAIERSRKYQYIILDLGVVSPEEFNEIDSDLSLAVLPCFHRLSRAKKWINFNKGFKYIADDEKTYKGWSQTLMSFSGKGAIDIAILPYDERYPSARIRNTCFKILEEVLPV